MAARSLGSTMRCVTKRCGVQMKCRYVQSYQTLRSAPSPFPGIPNSGRADPGKFGTSATSQETSHEHPHDRQTACSLEQIALVEPFEPSSNPNFKPERDYKGRVVLLNRDPFSPSRRRAAFAEQNTFELLAEDQIALNRLVSFKVETFEPREGFTPTKTVQDAAQMARSVRSRSEQAFDNGAVDRRGSHGQRS